MATDRYYWLRLKKDFFTDKRIKKLRKVAGGDTYTIIYLKMQLLSLQDKGNLYFENIEDTFEEEIALQIDEDVEDVKITINFLINTGLLVQIDDFSYELIETKNCIGSETAVAERVRKSREKKKLELENGNKIEEIKQLPKTNAERQKQHRAKVNCEAKQHIPYIEDYVNNKRYNGNYYIVMQRDRYKCAICGGIEDLCVHHIDGFDENKPENNSRNKMITLCRKCHSNIHNGKRIDEDILNSIEYYENSNEMLPSNIDVTKCNIEKEKEKEIEINKKENIKRKNFTKPTVEEIQAYCKERNNGINANAFYDFYESKDWYVGKNKMKDWKACVRTWEQRNKQNKVEEQLPEWFNKELKNEQMSEQDKQEMNNLLDEIINM